MLQAHFRKTFVAIMWTAVYTYTSFSLRLKQVYCCTVVIGCSTSKREIMGSNPTRGRSNFFFFLNFSETFLTFFEGSSWLSRVIFLNFSGRYQRILAALKFSETFLDFSNCECFVLIRDFDDVLIQCFNFWIVLYFMYLLYGNLLTFRSIIRFVFALTDIYLQHIQKYLVEKNIFIRDGFSTSQIYNKKLFAKKIGIYMDLTFLATNTKSSFQS